jgi:hypothetical protein
LDRSSVRRLENLDPGGRSAPDGTPQVLRRAAFRSGPAEEGDRVPQEAPADFLEFTDCVGEWFAWTGRQEIKTPLRSPTAMFSLQIGLSVTLLTLAPAALASAQGPDSPQLEGFRPRANSHLLEGAPVSVGPDWIAAYDARGMTFCPALGEEAPRTHEVRWSLDAVSVGGVLVEGVDLYAEPTLVKGTVVYDRGGVTEYYEALDSGLEQFFRLESLPSRSGDLVVSGQLSSGFDVFSDPARRRLVLRDLAGRGVNIDTVVAIDADGDRVDGTVRRVDGRMEIVIPAEFVATADLPLIVDPLFGVENPGSDGTFDAYQVDIAYGNTGDGTAGSASQYALAYTRRFSATQFSVQSGLFDDFSGSTGQTVLLKGFPLEYDQNPAIAFNRPNGKFVVAWENALNPDAQRDIEVNSFRIGTGQVDARLALTSSALIDEAMPDIGGEDQDSANYDNVVVVYTSKDATGLFGSSAALVRTAAVNVESSPVTDGSDLLDDASVSDVVGVSISKSGGKPGIYVIALDDRDLLGRGDTHIARCDTQGQINSLKIWPKESPSSKNTDQSDIAFDGYTGLVVVRETDVATGKTYIMGRKIDGMDGVSVAFDGDPFEVTESDLGSFSTRNESEPAVGMIGDDFLVAYTVESTSGLFDEVFMRSFDASTCTSCEPETLVSTSSGSSEEPEIATHQAGGELDEGEAAIAFNTFDFLSGPLLGSADGPAFHLWRESDGGADPIQVSGGCGKGGFMVLYGSTAIGSDDLTARLGYAEGTTFAAILNVSFATPSLPIGDCEILPPGFLLQSELVIDSSTGTAFAEVPIPLPCNGNLDGQTLAFQFWALGTTVSPAGIYSNVSFSNRVDLPLEF